MGITRISISYGATSAVIEIISSPGVNNTWQRMSGNIPHFPAGGRWAYQANSVLLYTEDERRVGLISAIDLRNPRAFGYGYLWTQGSTNPIICRWLTMRVF